MRQSAQHTRISGAGGTVIVLALLGFTRVRTWGVDVAPIRLAAAEPAAIWLEEGGQAFARQCSGVTLIVERVPAHLAVGRLLTGRADAAVIPRPASEQELTTVRQASGAELRGYPLALGGVVVIVHSSNPMESLSVEQIGDMLQGRARTWQQLGVRTVGTPLAMPKRQRQAHEQHGDEEGDLPAAIGVLVPSAQTGLEEWLRMRTLGMPEVLRAHPRLHTRAEMIRGVIDDVRSIGFVSWPAPDGVKTLAVCEAADATCVVPTPGTLSDRRYPLAHYVYLYTTGEPSKGIRALVSFLYSPEGQGTITPETGLLPLPFFSTADHSAKDAGK